MNLRPGWVLVDDGGPQQGDSKDRGATWIPACRRGVVIEQDDHLVALGVAPKFPDGATVIFDPLYRDESGVLRVLRVNDRIVAVNEKAIIAEGPEFSAADGRYAIPLPEEKIKR